MAVLEERDKARVRRHLGYPGVASQGSYSLGIPTSRVPTHLVEHAMDNVLDSSVPDVVMYLDQLDAIDSVMVEAATDMRLAAQKIGSIDLNNNEPKQLREEYVYRAEMLCDLLGVPWYGFSSRFTRQGGSIRSVRVRR